MCPPTVLLRIEFTGPDSLQPAGELLPHLSTLTGIIPAVYLCCTFPEVAFGGRYPLSLPCGARTFLVYGLSACTRGCLAYSPDYFTRFSHRCLVEILKNLYFFLFLLLQFKNPCGTISRRNFIRIWGVPLAGVIPDYERLSEGRIKLWIW